MKYFVTNNKRENTAYVEFSKGPWDGMFFHEDSLNIDGTVMHDCGLEAVIQEVYPEFDIFEISEINKRQWNKIRALAEQVGGTALEAFKEIDEWAVETFKKFNVFMILGL